MAKCETKDCDCWMANECLDEVKEGLIGSEIDMSACPPMFYREAIHNLYVWTARASRDCQRDHNWHDGDDKAVAKCLVASIRVQGKAKTQKT